MPIVIKTLNLNKWIMLKILQILCGTWFFIGITAENEPKLKITLEKIEIISFNEEYVKNPIAIVFQYNSTHQAINSSGTLLKDLGMELMENVDIYGIENGEVHLITSAKDINVCDILTGDYPELEDLFKFGNFTKCPMKAGFYIVSNAVVDTNKIPSNAPRGSFILDIKTYDGSVQMSNGKLYLKVEDDVLDLR
ncbi:hypothetical protein RN001_001108 [Aquatica leii]|uniref:Uncharacterized protein n=1 Tax=Aquatica leii TaxID=1421715 RepID=A0AAN7SJF6_9COLE|nr:hypothetical protein RN001_001108 [Aquatica leii]